MGSTNRYHVHVSESTPSERSQRISDCRHEQVSERREHQNSCSLLGCSRRGMPLPLGGMKTVISKTLLRTLVWPGQADNACQDTRYKYYGRNEGKGTPYQYHNIRSLFGWSWRGMPPPLGKMKTVISKPSSDPDSRTGRQRGCMRAWKSLSTSPRSRGSKPSIIRRICFVCVKKRIATVGAIGNKKRKQLLTSRT